MNTENMSKEEVKSKIAELKAQRRALCAANHDRVIAYRQCAADGRALGVQIKALEASTRSEKVAVKLESLTVAQVEQILADLKAKNAAE